MLLSGIDDDDDDNDGCVSWNDCGLTNYFFFFSTVLIGTQVHDGRNSKSL